MKILLGFSIFFLLIVGGGILYVQNPDWFSQDKPDADVVEDLNSEQKPPILQNQVVKKVEKITPALPNQNDIPVKPQTTPSQPQSFSGLTNAQLKAEFEKALPLKCTLKETYPNNSGSSEMTLYYTKNAFKINTATSYPNNTIISTHTILNNFIYYNWRDGGGFGLKVDVRKIPESPYGNGKQSIPDFLNSKNPNEVSSMICFPWTVDNSVFVPPPSIQFVDENSPHELLEKAYEESIRL